jgi:hypothetical protein
VPRPRKRLDPPRRLRRMRPLIRPSSARARRAACGTDARLRRRSKGATSVESDLSTVSSPPAQRPARPR